MSAAIIPFPKHNPALDARRVALAEEVVDFATGRVAETIGEDGISLDGEIQITLLLACSLLEAEAAEDGPA